MKRSRRMRIRSIFIFSVALMLMFSFVSSASATNGYFAHGYSTKNKALGGAGTALPLDSLAASSNPAGMAFVGNRADIGISFFNPNREYTVTGAPSGAPGTSPLAQGTVESDSEWFIIPSLGANWMLDSNSSLGLSIYGNGGMNTDYDTATYAGGSSPTGVDLSQLFVMPSYAVKVHSGHSFGIGVIGAYQSFEAQGLEGFAGVSQEPDNLTNNGHDSSYGYGARIGYLGEVLPGLFFGASYQTKIYMSEYDDYAGLFAQDGDFDIPANWSAGFAYKPVPELAFVFDVQQIFYSDVDSIANDFSGFNTCYGAVMTTGSAVNSEQCLGGDQGIGFGWNDMTIYKFGIEWQSSPDWAWRVGYSYGEQPIPDSEVLFNIIAPGVIEEHATAGFSKAIGNSQELNFALMYAFENEVSGANPQDTAQTIELQMNQWEITVGYAWKF